VVAEDLGHITLQNAKTPGERLYVQYGITGVRGQAEAGFPAVLTVGIPIFREGLSRGLSMNDAGCAALLHLLAATDDTNLIHRSDRQTQLEIRDRIARLVKENPFPDQEMILALDEEFIQRNLSPGGTADLLAMTYLLDALT
jgi:triphosphoribosyl-dephospho-CoA synthetase